MQRKDGDGQESGGGGQQASECVAGKPDRRQMQQQVNQMKAERVIALQLVVGPKGEGGERADTEKGEVEGTARRGVSRIAEDGVVVKMEATGDRRSEGQCGGENQQEGGTECYAL